MLHLAAQYYSDCQRTHACSSITGDRFWTTTVTVTLSTIPEPVVHVCVILCTVTAVVAGGSDEADF